MGKSLDRAGRPIILSPASAIRIWCPKSHTRRHGDGMIVVDPKTGFPASPEMAWDPYAHGWVCTHIWKAGERGRHAVRCSVRYALGYAFADENAAVLLEIGRPIDTLRLSRELLFKVSTGEAVVPWLVANDIPEPTVIDREFEDLMKSSRNVLFARGDAA